MNIKKIINTILLFFVINSVSAQHQTDSIIKTNAVGVPVERSYFAYDANNYQTLAMHYTFNKKTETWAGTYRETATYDNVGNCLSKNISHWNFDTNNWIEMIIEKSSFDTRGRRLTFDSKTWNKERSMWLGTTKSEREYNAMGLLSVDYTFAWNDDVNDWAYNQRIEYTYNDKGQCVKQVTSNWKKEWVYDSQIEYQYDGVTHRVTQETTKLWNNNEWALSTQATYTYGEKASDGSYTVVRLEQKNNNGIWTDSQRLTRQLDAKEVELTLKLEEYRNSKWLVVRRERADVKYDSDGNKIFDERYRWNGNDEWIGLRKEEMAYNDYGDLTKEQRMKWDIMTNAWAGLDYVVYNYGSMGELTLEQHYKWDRSQKAWVDMSIMKFEYDEYHNKILESTSSWNSVKQTWEEFYKGKYVYMYDGEGNIKSVEEYIGDKKKWKPVSTTRYY